MLHTLRLAALFSGITVIALLGLFGAAAFVALVALAAGGLRLTHAVSALGAWLRRRLGA